LLKITAELAMCLICMTVGIYDEETPCTHTVRDGKFNYGQITQYNVTVTVGMYCCLSNISSEILVSNFGCLSSGHTIMTSARM